MKDSGLEEGYISGQPSWLQGERKQLAGSKEGAPCSLQTSLHLSSQEHAPHFNMASSGGFAVGPEVTIQETYKNSAHDGDNPICPGTLA